LKKYFILLIVCLFFAGFQQNPAYAKSKTDTLVNSAVTAGNTLRALTIVESKATGKNIPTKEYNDAVKKYNSAKLQVNQLTKSQRKPYLTKLAAVQVQIDRGRRYMAAVTAGLQLNQKRAILESYTKKGLLDDKTVNAYNSLSTANKNSASKFDVVYGSKTKNTILKLYKTPADGMITKLRSAVITKQAINESNKLLKAKASSSKMAVQYKIIVFNIDSVTQVSYKSKLKAEVKKLNAAIPSKMKTGTFANLILIETQLEELDALLSPGKSNQKVPGLYKTLSTRINSFPSSERQLLKTRFNKIMAKLKMSTKQIKELLTNTAVAKGVPPEVVKGIAVTENGNLQQFLPNGEVFKSLDNGYGLMQVTPLSPDDKRFDWNRVKYDLRYNIETGVNILLEKWKYSGSKIPTINNQEKNILENWYFTIMAYNGISMKNDPNRNKNAYQEQVFNYIVNQALLDEENPINIGKVKISENPKTHLPSFSEKMKYITAKKTFSTQLFKAGDQFTIHSNSNFRNVPSKTSKLIIKLPAGTKLKILSGPIEDVSPYNLYCWYKVSITGKKGTWYIASANLR
jgi:hypothetical protein